ncbi:MAG: hypothetical protein QG608_2975 [Actinomycetota bacterium]|nr:hypothetical protein [Actinomycetota bacterium]
MSLAAQADQTLDELRARQEALISELRDVDHWRRLVEARLDLAVAAVTCIDELALRRLPPTGAPPCELHALLGIPSGTEALAETSVLVRLRETLRVLGEYSAELQACLRGVSQDLAERLVLGAQILFHPDQLSEQGTVSDEQGFMPEQGTAFEPRTVSRKGIGPRKGTVTSLGSASTAGFGPATGTEDNTGTSIGADTGTPAAASDESRGIPPRSGVVWLPITGGADEGSA